MSKNKRAAEKFLKSSKCFSELYDSETKECTICEMSYRCRQSFVKKYGKSKCKYADILDEVDNIL